MFQNGPDDERSTPASENAARYEVHTLCSLRKNGFFGTEVFHLAHPEHSRAHEAVNRERVLQRMRGNVVRADAGLAQAAAKPDVILTELN